MSFIFLSLNIEHLVCDIHRDPVSVVPVYSVNQKNSHLRFSDIFPKQLGIFSPNFTRLLYVPVDTRVQIFI